MHKRILDGNGVLDISQRMRRKNLKVVSQITTATKASATKIATRNSSIGINNNVMIDQLERISTPESRL